MSTLDRKMKNMASSGHQDQNQSFTVKMKPKIEIIEEKKKNKTETTICLSLFKWISTFFIFMLTLFCLVGSKLTIISVAQRLHKPTWTVPRTASDKCSDESCTSETAFVMLILIMMVPNVIGFLRALLNASFSSTEAWPTKVACGWGILGAVLETIGLCLFNMVLISSTQDFTLSVLLMNAIFIIPLILQLINNLKSPPQREQVTNDGYAPLGSNRPRRALRRGRSFTTLLFSIAALCGIAGFSYMIYLNSTIDRIIFPIFMICISIAWSPRIFYLQCKPKPCTPEYIVEKGQQQMTEVDEYQVSNVTLTNSNISVGITARNRMTLISSLIKLILVPLFAFLLNYLFSITSMANPVDIISHGFEYFRNSKQMLTVFILQIITSLFGYLLCWLACTMNLQKICFTTPLLLSTPIAVLFSTKPFCEQMLSYCGVNNAEEKLWEVAIVGGLLWLSQVLSVNWELFKPQQFLMACEESLFWLPAYDATLLEQHLLLNRKNEFTDEEHLNYHEIVKQSHIYICTTMYHETDFEMEQLLQSLAKIDVARKECGRQFEAHIFFDDGARGDVVKVYALQLLSLLKNTMAIDPGNVFKLETPYGLQLKWFLPNGMPFVVHLKDKVKVKSKKRWSQVMYMSYVLDFKVNQVDGNDDLTYILATDADVKFTPNDVMALMDFMSRNPKVGAVCGRTHPLGSGPMVWYQIFDYAIGHWLLKVANHVYGSVLCSPGCFSVYRAKAVRDILPEYATGADCAMDFLMKDMGEDRWFCTLMVEAGWKLEYCATAENSTYCPDNFDEFFKQRRRWGPSTLANSLVVLNEQTRIRENNDAINIFFIIYQVVLLISSVIGPSTVLLVIAGGLQYAFPEDINMIAVLVTLIVVTVLFTVICLFCKQDTQLKCAKFLTLIFAIVMAVAIVGIIHQTVDDVNSYTDPLHATGKPPINPNTTTTIGPPLLNPFIFNPSTWYLFTITGIFLITALMHGFEGIYVIHGIWYLLCLPSGYLLLTIYSVCNLTDRSWGTREGKTSSETHETPTFEIVKKYMKHIFWCCVPPHLRLESQTESKQSEKEIPDVSEPLSPEEDVANQTLDSTDGVETYDDSSEDSGASHKIIVPVQPKKSAMKKSVSIDNLGPNLKPRSSSFHFPGQDKNVRFSSSLPRLHSSSPVEDWLPKEYQCYVENFKRHGYDTVAFIAGAMREKDLMNIGITIRGHRKRLMIAIDALPPEELFQEVPENVEEWLINLGLEEYWPRFEQNSYTEPRDLADIKYLSKELIMAFFKIEKEGHLKRLMMATSVLQYPTKAQTLIREARKAISSVTTKSLESDNADQGTEYEFWFKLREICLLPEQAAFNSSGELAEKLGDLRDTALLILAVSNVLWLTFMVSIMTQGDSLEVFGSSFASVGFLMVYSVVLIFQFLSMIIHRLETGIHFIARAPFKPGHFKSNWSWRDEDLPPPPDLEYLEEIRRKRRRRVSNESYLSVESARPSTSKHRSATTS